MNLEDIRIVDRPSGVVLHGVDALSFVGKRLNESMQRYLPFLEKEEGRFVYEIQLFIEVQKSLNRQARYLGTLRNLLELIERDLPREVERAPYWDILASQITATEARYIFYCCLVSEKGDALRELLHRSNMLDSRIANANLSMAHRQLYERIHGLKLPRRKTQLVMPYEKSELKQLRKLAKRELRQKGLA